MTNRVESTECFTITFTLKTTRGGQQKQLLKIWEEQHLNRFRCQKRWAESMSRLLILPLASNNKNRLIIASVWNDSIVHNLLLLRDTMHPLPSSPKLEHPCFTGQDVLCKTTFFRPFHTAFFSPYEINKNVSWNSNLAVGCAEYINTLLVEISPETPERDTTLTLSLSVQHNSL